MYLSGRLWRHVGVCYNVYAFAQFLFKWSHDGHIVHNCVPGKTGRVLRRALPVLVTEEGLGDDQGDDQGLYMFWNFAVYHTNLTVANE